MSSSTAKGFPFGFPNQVGVSGTTEAGPLIQEVPTTPADISETDSYLFQIAITNGTGSAITITVADKQSTPLHVMSATSVPANTTVAFNWEEGIFCKGGITWSASDVGLEASVVAFSRA